MAELVNSEAAQDGYESSCATADSVPPSRPPLPVMALRERIVEKIKENRVTLIVGDTGCGKSSQVPQFLLEENIQPVLCTQPRRFAVVTIARMVAKARNCGVGDEVGYHIGHSNVTSPSSKIVFKTAGVLLEQMRDRGLAALKYKVIILDEVHERSVESDLVLAFVKQFMLKNHDMRVVLMSATANISRYRDYFKDLGRGERVEVLAIPHAPKQTIFQRKLLYIDQIDQILGTELGSSAKYSSAFGSTSDAHMSDEEHKLIHKLILHIHENESDIRKSILVFLPTYQSLEQQWILLKSHLTFFKVHILHRSIDTEHALSALEIWKSHRKVILATNIAESSVTIPGVAYVIDSCRSLQVFWDRNRNSDAVKLVWVSKSQADQRKGRTGRTCDGFIYRLVSRSFYNSLDDHEFPAILRLSLRQQVLMICCAESKAISDPKVLLQKLMDPPQPEVVEEALKLLVHICALEKRPSHRDRYTPTFYGRLLDNLPLTFDASLLLLKFGEIGLLREGIIISILMDIQPQPILQPFGQQYLFAEYLSSYFEDIMVIGKKENMLMGNLFAFQFWECVFKDKHRLEQLKQMVKVGEPTFSLSLITKLEEEWCYMHNLVPTAVNNIFEIYNEAISTIHRFRPKFLHKTDGMPHYYDHYEFRHTCLIQSEPVHVDEINENHETDGERRKCLSLPFVSTNDFQATNIANNLANVVKEIRVLCDVGAHKDMDETITYGTSNPTVEICKFYVLGLCNRGDQCFFSHSFQAKKPQCKFFLTLQGCRYGDSCFFSHDHGPYLTSSSIANVCQPEDAICPDSLPQLLSETVDGYVLILNDKNLHFTLKISEHLDPTKIFVTRPRSYVFEKFSSSVGFTELYVDQDWFSIIETPKESFIPWMRVQCALWIGDFEDTGAEVHRDHLKHFFECLAVRTLADNLSRRRVIIVMNNMIFSRLQVERLARECFFYLTKSFPIDESIFGVLSDTVGMVRPMRTSLTVSYLFDMHPPSSKLFGDYSSSLREGLYNDPCRIKLQG